MSESSKARQHGEAGRLWYLILAAQREGQRSLAEALSPLGVTPAQAEVLAVLAAYPQLSLAALGERLVCETGSPSRLVSVLVEGGWVRRVTAPADRRAVLLSLTPQGRALAEECQAQTGRVESDLGAAVEVPALEAALHTLWSLISHRPAGRALKRRAGGS